jgi:ferredoxin
MPLKHWKPEILTGISMVIIDGKVAHKRAETHLLLREKQFFAKSYIGGDLMILVDLEKCRGCGICVKNCPLEAIELVDKKAKTNDNCVVCGICF